MTVALLLGQVCDCGGHIVHTVTDAITKREPLICRAELARKPARIAG